MIAGSSRCYLPKTARDHELCQAQVNKPERIFDRAREWEGLVQFATSSSANVRLGIVSGRRRQGKTYLLDAAANTFGGFFFTATDSTQTDSLASFGRALASCSGGGRYAFADWDEALERLFGVVGDEFPYLMKASPSLPSLIQRALGPRGYAQQSSARLCCRGRRCRSWASYSPEARRCAGGPPGTDHPAVRLPRCGEILGHR